MRRSILFALVLAGAALLTPAVTHAQPLTQPIPASGTFALLGPPEVLSSQTVGGTTFITQRSRYRLTGTFTGTTVAEERVILLPTGDQILVGQHTFTGTVAGRSGTARFVTVARGDATAFQGQFTILSGTGGLANLRGQGTFEGSAQTFTGTYAGTLFFGP